MKNYDDILYLPHPTSTKHSRMAILDRAAQFSPFAALTGYEDAVEETARLTEDFVELDEDQKAELNEKVKKIQGKTVMIRFFQEDEKKEGGTYQSIRGKVKKIDKDEKRIVLEEGMYIELDTIVGIEL